MALKGLFYDFCLCLFFPYPQQHSAVTDPSVAILIVPVDIWYYEPGCKIQNPNPTSSSGFEAAFWECTFFFWWHHIALREFTSLLVTPLRRGPCYPECIFVFWRTLHDSSSIDLPPDFNYLLKRRIFPWENITGKREAILLSWTISQTLMAIIIEIELLYMIFNL